MEQAIAERAAPLLTDQPDDCLLSVSGLLFHQAFGPAEDFQALAQLVAFASTCKPVRTAVQPCVEAARRALHDLVSDIVSAGDLHNGPAAQAHSQTMGSWRCPLRLRSLLAAAPGVSNAVVDEENGNTALMLACKLGHIEIARWLLVHGADAGLVNRHGQRCVLGAAGLQTRDWQTRTYSPAALYCPSPARATSAATRASRAMTSAWRSCSTAPRRAPACWAAQ